MRRTEGIPLARVSQIIQIMTALEGFGTSSERLLRRLNMPMWHHCAAEGFVPLEHIFTLLDLGARTVGTDTFGMRVMECVPFQRIGILGTLTIRAPNLYQALQTFVRFVPIQGSSKRYWLAEGRDEVWLCRGGKTVFEAGEREMIQYAVTGMVQIVRLAAGSGWRPSKVKVQATDRLSLETTEMFSQARIQPNPAVSAIAIPRSLLNLPLHRISAPRASSGQICGECPAAAPPADDFAGSICQIVATLLSQGYPRIESAAKVVGVHVRTLQRMLAEDGLTYKQLVDEARFEVATGLLGEPGATVTDIAFDLGYSDVAHFTRAFRRWAGVSPREYCRMNATT